MQDVSTHKMFLLFERDRRRDMVDETLRNIACIDVRLQKTADRRRIKLLHILRREQIDIVDNLMRDIERLTTRIDGKE